MPPQGCGRAACSPSTTPNSNQDSHMTTADADPAAQTAEKIHIDPGFDNYDFMFADDPAPADAPDDRRRCSTDADMPGVNAAAAASPHAVPLVPVGMGGGAHAAAAPCCSTGTTEIQRHLEEEEQEDDAQRRLVDELQRLIEEVDPLAAPDERLVEAPAHPAPAPEDGPSSSGDAEMPEVNHDAATQPGPPLPVVVVDVGGGDACATRQHVEEEAPLSSFKRATEQDLMRWADMDTMLWEALEAYMNASLTTERELCEAEVASTMGRAISIVRSTGPDSKGTKPHQGGWKEKSMTGMRAVVDQALPQPRGQRQQQQQQPRYVGLKKTLELDDDGKGNKWRAHEYTPLLPSDDGTNKLVPTDISLRIEFKQDDPPSSSLSSKRSRNGAPKDGGPKTPVKSPVWEHMTKVHVKVAPTNTDDPRRNKNPCYKVMYAICHHCDKVFNADSGHGTNNLSKHLHSCACNCTHSHSC